jgi:hypothetical protein
MQKWWNLASNSSPFGQNDIHLHACMLIEENPTQQTSNKKSHACVPCPSRYFHMLEAMHDWLTQKEKRNMQHYLLCCYFVLQHAAMGVSEP